MQKQSDIQLIGQNVSLRRVNIDDVSGTYVDWLNDPNVNQFLETRHQIQNQGTISEFISTISLNPNAYLLAIIDKKTNHHIGNIKLDIDTNHSLGIISLFIGNKNYWHKGYAAQAIALISKFGLEVKKLRKLSASAYSQNIGSIKTFQKAGYQIEARLTDHFLIQGKPCDIIYLAKMNT